MSGKTRTEDSVAGLAQEAGGRDGSADVTVVDVYGEGKTTSPLESKTLVGLVARREVRTVTRTWTYLLLGVALTAILVATTRLAGGMQGGYVPTIVDLLTPLELLVPIVAVAFGYRAIIADERRGELDVFRTYPIASWHVVAGVYVGRAIGVAVAILVPLLVVAFGVAVTDPAAVAVYASHQGADSPLLFGRFAVLTIWFALTMLAVTVAVSAIASTTRAAIALASLVLIGLLFGADLALVYGFSIGVIGEGSLVYSLALSPLSAYRGLVLETAVVVASGVGPRTASPLASAVGLCLWTAASLVVATIGVRR